MARDEALPFDEGETFYNGGPIDTTNLGGVNYEGMEFKVLDKVRGSGLYKTLRVVRNSGTVNLFPSRLAAYDPAYFGLRCNAETNVEGQYAAGAVDELLPSAGVVPNDLFYIVVQGPALLSTPAAGITAAVGDNLVAITAAGTTSADAGKVDAVSLVSPTGVTSEGTDYGLTRNAIGRAMSAMTSGQTNTPILVAIRW